MTITLEIRPETEAALRRQARSKGRGLEAFVASLLEDAAGLPSCPLPPVEPGFGQKLVDALGKMRGQLTDEEVDTLFSRNRSPSRPVNFE